MRQLLLCTFTAKIVSGYSLSSCTSEVSQYLWICVFLSLHPFVLFSSDAVNSHRTRSISHQTKLLCRKQWVWFYYINIYYLLQKYKLVVWTQAKDCHFLFACVRQEMLPFPLHLRVKEGGLIQQCMWNTSRLLVRGTL